MFEDEHWLRDKPWRIDDLSSVYKQLTSINHDMRVFRYYDTLAVLCNIIDLIKEAMENNEEVLIYRDRIMFKHINVSDTRSHKITGHRRISPTTKGRYGSLL